jgi:hypothetical protein
MNPSNPIHPLGTIDDLASLNDLRHQVQTWPTHTTVEPPQLHVVKTATLSGDEWSLSAEHRHVLHGEHTTRLSDVGGEDNTSQQKGSGWSVQAQRNSGPWRLTAYTNQWDMKATDSWKTTMDGVTYTFREPANQTRETGLRVTRFS